MTTPDVAAPGLVARVGLALARPRWALAVAGDRRYTGRSGTDLIIAILILLAATELRGLVGAVWLAFGVDTGLGFHAAMHVLTRALSVSLGFLVLGALVLWAGAGPRRNLGRAFDLACIAAIPLLALDLGATTIVRALETDIPQAAGWVLTGISWGWAGAVLALAWGPVRLASAIAVQPPREVVAIGRRAGYAVAAVAVAGLAVQLVWIARHVDLMRPISDGDQAPAFALPAITAGGAPGPRHELVRGKINVVDFWATWCGPCLRAMPALDGLARNHPDVVVLAVNLDDPAAARTLFDQHGYRMTLLADDGDASERFGVTTIPHTVLIDGDGIVRLVARGGHVDLERAIEQIRK
jgi:thiol-disulfide isomerase/thioredoxin